MDLKNASRGDLTLTLLIIDNHGPKEENQSFERCTPFFIHRKVESQRTQYYQLPYGKIGLWIDGCIKPATFVLDS